MVMLLIIVLILPLLWMTGFLVVTDFSVPLRDARQFHRVLVIFPHADDEVITCSGTLHGFSSGGSAVTLVLLTKGERGTPNAAPNVGLQDIREKQVSPTHKLFIGVSVFPKIKSWYTYKSQRASLTKGILKFLPIWFFLSMVLFEYFAEAS